MMEIGSVEGGKIVEKENYHVVIQGCPEVRKRNQICVFAVSGEMRASATVS